MNSKFDFYEIVKIHSSKKRLTDINGYTGVITGKSQSEDDPRVYAYAVDILNDQNEVEDGWFIFEDDSIPTGKKANPDDFSAGETVRVRVDPNTGEGQIVDD